MTASAKKGLLVSDFNAENFAAYLNNYAGSFRMAVEAVPYGQVAQTLLNPDLECWRRQNDFAVVWTRPEGVISGFQECLQSLPTSPEDVMRQVDEFSAQLRAASSRVRALFVPLWFLPAVHEGQGLRDLKANTGPSRLLLEMNLRLMQQLDGVANIFVLNSSKWIEQAGDKSFSTRLWYSAKVPYGNELFKVACADVASAVRAVDGRARKLLVLDLDDTLWGGIVGDGGWGNLVLGGHDPIGEAFVDFQRSLQALMRRGVVLAIISKNEEAVAIEAITKHPEMVLKLDDFAGWRINWKDKASNLVDLVMELNLGLESVVFIDDNPVERDRVRSSCPEVLVPDWPADKRLYSRTLQALDCFDKPFDTAEDRQRPAMYTTERRRNELKAQSGSVDDWLSSLGMVIKIDPLTDADVARTSQLLNKTNQMNLRTRRLSESELLAWSRLPAHQIWTVRVSDKFGDSGLTGVISAELDGDEVRLADFVLSCRVMGRKVEEAMLRHVVEWATSQGAKKVRAEYLPTPRNNPCLEVLVASRWARDASDCFTWDTSTPYSTATTLAHVG